MSDDALDYPARQGEEAIRQLDMLRHTLKEWIAQNEALYVAPMQTVTPAVRAAINAYKDVLTLLGPEPAWTVDPDTLEPF